VHFAFQGGGEVAVVFGGAPRDVAIGADENGALVSAVPRSEQTDEENLSPPL